MSQRSAKNLKVLTNNIKASIKKLIEAFIFHTTNNGHANYTVHTKDITLHQRSYDRDT